MIALQTSGISRTLPRNHLSGDIRARRCACAIRILRGRTQYSAAAAFAVLPRPRFAASCQIAKPTEVPFKFTVAHRRRKSVARLEGKIGGLCVARKWNAWVPYYGFACQYIIVNLGLSFNVTGYSGQNIKAHVMNNQDTVQKNLSTS